MKRISISLEDALALRALLPHEEHGPCTRFRSAIARAERVNPARKSATAKKAKARRTKRTETAEIYAEVEKRAAGKCECGCGRSVVRGGFFLAPVLDHFFGRGKIRQAVENCWLLAEHCDFAKTRNSPSAETWIMRFIAHCERHDYRAEAERALKRLEALRLIEQAKGVGR